uniref:Putative secreted protein n=1 Tax=Panstrongylus lignarius TaxID=156445 RepID=A0A224Y182_9HEMI
MMHCCILFVTRSVFVKTSDSECSSMGSAQVKKRKKDVINRDEYKSLKIKYCKVKWFPQINHRGKNYSCKGASRAIHCLPNKAFSSSIPLMKTTCRTQGRSFSTILRCPIHFQATESETVDD